MYKILPYTYSKAEKLGVFVLPSDRRDKKIDIYSFNGEYLCSVGAKGYKDYPTYLKLYGKKIADERRRLYKIRHAINRKKKGSPGWFADQLLW